MTQWQMILLFDILDYRLWLYKKINIWRMDKYQGRFLKQVGMCACIHQ